MRAFFVQLAFYLRGINLLRILLSYFYAWLSVQVVTVGANNSCVLSIMKLEKRTASAVGT